MLDPQQQLFESQPLRPEGATAPARAGQDLPEPLRRAAANTRLPPGPSGWSARRPRSGMTNGCRPACKYRMTSTVQPPLRVEARPVASDQRLEGSLASQRGNPPGEA